jgi:hypothetical protein
MATSKIRVTVPFSIKETFRRLSDHTNLKNIVDQVTTSDLIKVSDSCHDKNGLGAIRQITFKGDLLTEKVVNWLPPEDIPTAEPMRDHGTEVGFDYKVIAGKRLIADHLGVIRITEADTNSSHIAWDIHLKIPLWATGEIAAYFVCRTMEKEITRSIKNNMRHPG